MGEIYRENTHIQVGLMKKNFRMLLRLKKYQPPNEMVNDLITLSQMLENKLLLFTSRTPQSVKTAVLYKSFFEEV